MKDVIQMYLHEPGAAKYRDMDMTANDGHLPERTTLLDNICFCLITPTYDQCADPIYTQWRANQPGWHKQRALWHKNGGCGSSCACSSSWFHEMSSTETRLHECVLCEPVMLTSKQ